MRVLINMPLGEQRGGGEMMLLDLIRQGRDLDVEWLVIFLEDGPMVEQVRGLGVDARVVLRGRGREVHRFILTVIRIAAIAWRKKVDIIVNWMWITHILGGLSALLVGKPAIWYQLEVPYDQALLTRLATLIPARAVITLSKDGQKAQSQIFPYRPTLLVYPGVELNRFDPAILPSASEARQKLGLPSHGTLVGIVGRLQRWKGMHVVVDAMPKVLQKYPDTHCVIVGGQHSFEPEYENFLKDQIAAMGLQEKVIMAGLQQNVPEWVQAMDIFIHASDKEPFGIVIIEAMVLGKAVIAGDVGGPTEIITNKVNGLLTPYGDADALSNAMLRYLDDSEFTRNVGIAARKRALEFSTRRYAENFVDVIYSVLQKVPRLESSTDAVNRSA
jgi:glycosyltransferase involved in cell wall biosynthesis